MASKYITGINPFRDFIFTSIMYGVDVTDNDIKNDIHNSMIFILENVLDDLDELKYLDFDIVKRNNVIRVVGNNIISALWLSGIIPYETEEILKRNRLEFNDYIYTFNNKKRKLTWKRKG